MKKLLMIGLLGLSFGACQRGGMSQAAVPDQVITAFNQRYPYATEVEWDESEGLFEADFRDGNSAKEATFRSDGTLLEVNESM